MRTLYSILLLLCVTLISSAQVKTWIGPNNGSWGDMNNWSPTGVPNGSNDVIIPSGSVVIVDVNAGADSLTVQSGATLNKTTNNGLGISSGVFQTGSVLNMMEGDITCAGILVIDGSVNGVGPLTKGFRNGLIEVNNSMTIDAGSGPFRLRSNTLRINPSGTLNLPGEGILDIAAFTATLDNQGLIQKTGGTGDFTIDVVFENNGGTVDVSSGNLAVMVNPTLSNGVYNVSSGASITISDNVAIAGTLTGVLDGPLIAQGGLNPPTGDTARFNFTGSDQLEWAGGTISGGDLINESQITITGTFSNTHTVNGSTLLNNGVIDLVNNSRITIGNATGLLHNSPVGAINLLDSNLFTGFFSGQFLNEGTIVKALSGKNAFIRVGFTNDGGTISVLGDTLVLANASGLLNGGQYDVVAGAALSVFDGPAFDGTLTGQLDGPMRLLNSNFSFPPVDTAIFNFSGSAQVQWEGGSLTGGNLRNMSTIHAIGGVNPIPMQSGLQFINEGVFNLNSPTNMSMTGANTTFVNTLTGVLDIQSDNDISGGGAFIMNLGLIQKTGGTANSDIFPQLFHDDPGMILAETGGLVLQNIQPGDGDFSGAGSLWIGNGYVVEGDVFPGNSPGTLNILSDYNSSPSAVLHLELDGINAGTDFDVLAIDDDAILKGDLNVTLGFAAAVNDQFEIITATSVDSCLLPSTVSTTFNGSVYTFDVICGVDNVTLGVISVGIDELQSGAQVKVYPNPISANGRVEFGGRLKGLSNANLTLYDNLGQVLRNWQLDPRMESMQVERDGIPSGLYFLRLSSDEGVTAMIPVVFD